MAVGTQLDLKLIDETYGTSADLYQDVLRVSNTATHDEIQLAYFDRRSELFTLLAKIDANARGLRNELSNSPTTVDQRRFVAEKKMDSVVFAVRVLADPALRNAYNMVRSERTGITPTSVGNTVNESPTTGSNSSGAGSESPTKSKNLGKQHQPAESPPVIASASSDSKSWIHSTFTGSLFSNLSSKDDSDEGGEEDRNPRKSRRQQKQQQSSSLNRDEPVQELEGGKEKRSIWGRKKKNKKKQGKEFLNDSMDTNPTDTSMTDQEDGDGKNYTRDGNSIIAGPQSSENDTVDTKGTYTLGYDDDTLRDDDTRTLLDDGETFASGSMFSSTDGIQEGGACEMFGCLSGSRAFKRIATEVSGACEDTLMSVDQVFNAFTLTDKDIKAVKKKIVRAQKQLES